MKKITLLLAFAFLILGQSCYSQKAKNPTTKTMNRIIVNIKDDLVNTPNIEELLPKEFAKAAEYKKQGFLEHLFIKDDKSGAVLVFKNVDLAKAKELVSGYPMFKYFKAIEYIEVEKQH